MHVCESTSASRRTLLAGACAAAGALVLGSTAAFARARPKGLIDVHHHVLPPRAPAAMVHHLEGWSPAKAMSEMDAAGIATGIAYPGPIRSGDAAERKDLARLWNEFTAQIGEQNPGRFGLFASLPFPHVDQCLAEIDYAYDHLKADGFGITTSYDDLWLGDEKLWPIYEKLNSRDAVVFVHPHDAACCAKMSYQKPIMDGSWIEWPISTARTIMSLMVSGTFRKFPRIRFIFAHGAGVMPLLIERIAGLSAWSEVGDKGIASLFPNGVKAEFRSLHFECAQACSPTNMAALRSLVPDTQILFGSDYPFFSLDYASRKFADLHLPASIERQMGSRNAARLLPRWA